MFFVPANFSDWLLMKSINRFSVAGQFGKDLKSQRKIFSARIPFRICLILTMKKIFIFRKGNLVWQIPANNYLLNSYIRNTENGCWTWPTDLPVMRRFRETLPRMFFSKYIKIWIISGRHHSRLPGFTELPWTILLIIWSVRGNGSGNNC